MGKTDDRGISEEEWALFGSSSQPTDRREVTQPQESNVTSKQEVNLPGRRKTKYPWEVWMDGNEHVAVRGKDFDLSVSVFQTMLHNTGKRYDLIAATTMVDGTDDEVLFRFCKTPQQAAGVRYEWRQPVDDGYPDVNPDEVS